MLVWVSISPCSWGFGNFFMVSVLVLKKKLYWKSIGTSLEKTLATKKKWNWYQKNLALKKISMGKKVLESVLLRFWFSPHTLKGSCHQLNYVTHLLRESGRLSKETWISMCLADCPSWKKWTKDSEVAEKGASFEPRPSTKAICQRSQTRIPYTHLPRKCKKCTK